MLFSYTMAAFQNEAHADALALDSFKQSLVMAAGVATGGLGAWGAGIAGFGTTGTGLSVGFMASAGGQFASNDLFGAPSLEQQAINVGAGTLLGFAMSWASHFGGAGFGGSSPSTAPATTRTAPQAPRATVAQPQQAQHAAGGTRAARQQLVNTLQSRVAAATPAEVLMPGGRAIGQAGASSQIRVLSGGTQSAETVFRTLTSQGSPVTAAGYPGTVMRLPGGGTVGLRSVARGTGARQAPAATIDVNISGISIRELKFLP